jgi:hypothetical protein
VHKYVRTPHINGSRFQHGDHDLEAVDWSELAGKHLVVEEKIDGSNVGVSFDQDGKLLLQSRGHYLRGGPREKQFDLFKQWAACHKDTFFQALGSRYVMYGEWMFAKHTFYYDALPHYFMEFDVLDTQVGDFLDTNKRKQLLLTCPVTSVLVLYEGAVASDGALANMITRSNFITDERIMNLNNTAEAAGVVATEAWKHTDHSTDMEGLYVKWEENGVVKGRYKYVRQSFTNSILDQEEHWHDRPIIQNRLLPGVFEKMFEQ